jgi:hypothetical protein
VAISRSGKSEDVADPMNDLESEENPTNQALPREMDTFDEDRHGKQRDKPSFRLRKSPRLAGGS